MGLFANWREKRRKLREEEELEQKRIEQKHRENIERWETENLNQYAGKVDGLILKKDEYCYLAIPENITWNEDRTRTKRIGYSGPTATVRIAKGFSYRVGSASVSSERITELKEVFSGGLFLTNKRIILLNSTGMKILNISKIVRLDSYTDGITLFRDSGKRIVLAGFSNAEKFNIYLQRIINGDFLGIDERKTEEDMKKLQNFLPKPKLIKFSKDDPRLRLKPLFVVSKETSIENADRAFLAALSGTPAVEDQEEKAILDRVLPVYYFADLLYKQGKWIQAEYQWLSIIDDMPNKVGEKLAILYRKEKRYKNEVEIIERAKEYAKCSIERYKDTNKIDGRLEKAKLLAESKKDTDNSLDLVK